MGELARVVIARFSQLKASVESSSSHTASIPLSSMALWDASIVLTSMPCTSDAIINVQHCGSVEMYI